MGIGYFVIIPIIVLIIFSYITFKIIRKKEGNALDYISPFKIFVIFTFIGFPLKMLISYISEDFLFFKNFPVNFSLSTLDYFKTFAVFLVGYVAFVLGYKTRFFKEIKKYRVPLSVNNLIRQTNSNLLMVLSAFFLIIDFYFKVKFKVGLLLVEPEIQFSGYILFFNVFSKLFISSIYFIRSFLKENNYFHKSASSIILLSIGVLENITMTKGGFVQVLLIILSVLFVIKFKKGLYPKSFMKMIIFVFVAILLLFPVIEVYRQEYMILGEGSLSLFNLAGAFFSEDISNISSYIPMIFSRVLSRVLGFEQLLPVVAYFKDQEFFLNFYTPLIENINYAPGEFYKSEILGLPLDQPGGFAATSWAFFYINFGIVGIFLFMFIWAKIIRYSFSLIKRIGYHNPEIVAGVLPIYLMWFYIMTIEGVFAYATKYLIGFVCVIVFWCIFFKLLTDATSCSNVTKENNCIKPQWCKMILKNINTEEHIKHKNRKDFV